MKLTLLVALTMIAFAANSVLNKIGLEGGAMDPMSFALIRLASGAAALCAMVWLSGRRVPLMQRSRVAGAVSLAVYMIGFSLAYQTLDAGVGALILFGGVQVTIFAVIVARGEAVPRARWQGAGVALIGLAFLLLPGANAPHLLGALLMGAAAVGWGFYTLAGRVEADALGATAGNFVWATLGMGICVLALGGDPSVTQAGTVYAVISGMITSAMGYALWYRILPQLEASIAGIAQLTVPIIALAGGMIFLGETLTLTFIFASALVLGGVAWSLKRG
ncbi:MAG: DMT family transporter [Pseudomonadota bacterium]